MGKAMVDHARYATLKPRCASYWMVLLICAITVGLGGYSALTMEHAGHIVTGMNNHVVWGLPHVFAVSLIVAASGALNGASLSSVFGLPHYKPVARLSVMLSMSLLVGGLLVLVLDLGRPDRLIIAMTTYNFRSIFTWNIFLYTGFLVVGAGYLWMMMESRYNRHTVVAGRMAFTWRIVLTTGTGCIFGFLVGRNALDSALLAPLFIALSLVMGTAVLVLIIVMLDRWHSPVLSDQLLQSFRRLQVWFLLSLVYFSVVHHLTNLYATEHHLVERYTLIGDISSVFWLGHILIGVLLPLCLLAIRSIKISDIRRVALSALLSLFGAMALLYVVIIGSQSTPQTLFPGKTIVESRFGDAGFSAYQPSVWEWGLGAGGMALALLLCLMLMRILPLLPETQPRSAGSTGSD